ncbi:MAG: proprotein convertase P-domain-containing protein [Pseudomonadota bacterium]
MVRITPSKLIGFLSIITALVAYSTNSLSLIFSYSPCANTNFVLLDSQADVDQFPVTYGGSCDTIDGSLRISGADITNLDGLQQIHVVQGSLTIESNTVLTKINGLAQLEAVGDDLVISQNPELSTLAPLDGLQLVDDMFSILDNPSLASLPDFTALESVRVMQIQGNQMLQEVSGFPALQNIDFLNISSNDSLLLVAGFPLVERIRTSLVISDMAKGGAITGFPLLERVGQLALRDGGVEQVTAFGKLKIITGNFVLVDTDRLRNLGGFGALKQVQGSVLMFDNKRLRNLAPLDGLKEIRGDVFLSFNRKLFSLKGLRKLRRVDGHINITSHDRLDNVDHLLGVSQMDSLSLTSNSALLDLDGLKSLNWIDDSLGIRSNNNLARCEGLAPVLGAPSGLFDRVGETVDISNNAEGCDSVAEILSSVSGPGMPGVSNASPRSSEVTLEFSPATTTDSLFPIEGYEATCLASDGITKTEGVQKAIPDQSELETSLVVAGVSGLDTEDISVGVFISHPQRQDIEVYLRSPAGTEVALWEMDNVPTSNLNATFPVPVAPSEPLSAFGSENFNGSWTLEVSDDALGDVGTLDSWFIRFQERITQRGESSPLTVSNMRDDVEYSCVVRAVTGLGLGPASAPILVTPMPTPPAAPTLTSIDSVDGGLIVSFTPGDQGGSPIDSYTVTCGDQSATGSGSPIQVSNLENGTEYACSVVASSDQGDSPASASVQATAGEQIFPSNVLKIIRAVEGDK